ncbi:uncharacterized protein LOC130385128 isoform X2 [Gadus chalcogrammus]|uniref:uncharacterized protein LOC130385127 isoform X2 n=1 Tax=Gadus chalcogrammus TaxID=1042646 RepID=UPI0024C25070|nr:uncharacterized protein LOC130385127 isoform X2 [Gadus chalcogrammus]XP_056449425.1 uncharacterized protein LOC130385128 isoform X2 [Gadus chalcogrammus]
MAATRFWSVVEKDFLWMYMWMVKRKDPQHHKRIRVCTVLLTIQRFLQAMHRGIVVWQPHLAGSDLLSGSQAATSMCDQLKSYLYSKRTAKQSTPLRSSTPAPDWSDDSDETSCDLFGPFKMRKVVLTSEEEGDDCIPQEEPEHQKEPEGQQQPVKVLVELEEETLKALKELPGLVAAIKTALEKLPSACTSSTLSQSECQQTPGSDTRGDDLGEDNCFYGTLLPTLETLISKTLDF